MINDDTVKLLNECNAGIKMAVSSIDEVLPKIEEEKFKQTLNRSKQEHEKLGDETHRMLNSCEDGGKEPSPIAKGMSWMKTNVTMTVKHSDHTAADLIADGCNMGVKSLSRYLNQYEAASEQSKGIAQELIQLEDQLSVDVRPYL